MKKIRVMIVEDSPTVRELLIHIISSDSRLEVAAAVDNGDKALEIIPRVDPDVISLDIRLPGKNGFEITQTVMSDNPRPIVVVSASVEADDLDIAMNAMKAGALSVIEKPTGLSHADYETISRNLCNQLVAMSEIKLIKQRFNIKLNLPENMRLSIPDDLSHCEWDFKALGIVCSTGGPNALFKVLPRLPADFPLPLFLVQHITNSFLRSFVEWIRSISKLAVVLVDDVKRIQPGTIYIAQEDHHLIVGQDIVQISRSAPVSYQRPSGTVLFKSMAGAFGSSAIGVILTGMGDDGARGLKEIKEAGGYTIAEHEATVVVNGMPGAANKIGAVCENLNINIMAGRILQLAKKL